MSTCAVDLCGTDARRLGYCEKHYTRWRRTGDPLATAYRRGEDPTRRLIPVKSGPSLVERFWDKVRTGDGCWTWMGAFNGYGHIRVGRRLVKAHRVSYELNVGPIPEGLEIDHLCRNKRCVNPAHLEPVTHAENWRRAGISRRSGRFAAA